MKPSKPLRLARAYKRAGGTRDAYLKAVNSTMRETAREEGWRQSELAMGITEYARIAEQVWPEEHKPCA